MSDGFDELIAGLDDIPAEIEDPWKYVDRFRAASNVFTEGFGSKEWEQVRENAQQLEQGMQLLAVEHGEEVIRVTLSVLEAISYIVTSDAESCPQGSHILQHVLPVLASYGLLLDQMALKRGVRPHAESPGA